MNSCHEFTMHTMHVPSRDIVQRDESLMVRIIIAKRGVATQLIMAKVDVGVDIVVGCCDVVLTTVVDGTFASCRHVSRMNCIQVNPMVRHVVPS